MVTDQFRLRFFSRRNEIERRTGRERYCSFPLQTVRAARCRVHVTFLLRALREPGSYMLLKAVASASAVCLRKEGKREGCRLTLCYQLREFRPDENARLFRILHCRCFHVQIGSAGFSTYQNSSVSSFPFHSRHCSISPTQMRKRIKNCHSPLPRPDVNKQLNENSHR